MNFIDACPKKWLNTEGGRDQVEFCGSLIDKYIYNAEVLLVGTGHSAEQYYDWPDTLMKCGAYNVVYLEIFDQYIQRWANKEYKIIKGDVRNIADIFTADSFDIILWIQGPEHINQSEMKKCFEDILKISRKLLLFTCPWGTYYDDQSALGGNIFEMHLQKNLTPESFKSIGHLYNIRSLGRLNAGDGVIIIWNER